MWNQGTLRTELPGAFGSHGFDAVLAQPAVDVVLVVLLAPQQPGQRLAHHQRARRRSSVERDDRRVERVGLVAAGVQHPIEVRTQRVARCRAARSGAPGSRRSRRRGPPARGGRRTLVPVRAGFTASARRATTKSLIASLTCAEAFGAPNRRSLLVSFSQNSSGAEASARSSHSPSSGCDGARAPPSAAVSVGLRDLAAPRPRVAEPQRREQVQRRRLRAAVVRGDQHEDVVVGALGVLDDHVEVAVLVEDRRCRAARTPCPACRGARWWPPGPRRGRPAAGTCTGTSGRSASGCCRGRTSTP